MNINDLEMLNIGMVGHIDHGKTTLLSQLTGKFADTHSEELKRGITIKLGYADAVIEKDGKKRYVSFVDCPGHEMLMATMLSGAALIDAAILVIAANEGIKPQTREHLIALQAKNVDKILIIQNKIDLVDKKQAMENYKAIKNFIKGTIAENSPIIPVSAQQGINIDGIRDYLLSIEVPERDLQSAPEFLIARSFDINRPGTEISRLHGGVIAGVLKKGTFKIGDEIEIKPGITEKHANQISYKTIRTKINSIYRGNHSIEEASPGGSLAFETELDNVITKSDSLSGSVVSKIGYLPEISDKIKLRFSLFPEMVGEEKRTKIEDLKLSETIMLSVNTTITIGRISKINKDEIELQLRIPVVPIKGDSVGFARNIHNHWRLIGFGEII
ncbi:translation initiation factor IF-2 subunit gamma [Candidatus Pacearchaeota archaeon]|nr:translation initiation factor IF-2 subunit gamma [Candidatus Pacearchaeota archaeon]MBD3283062.1 translation initiation factor IF-2 subunit gamma [Candidatus Pacearchaeota archaeon]